jgi:hypothetical protein
MCKFEILGLINIGFDESLNNLPCFRLIQKNSS